MTDDNLETEDFRFTASLLRAYANEDPKLFYAVCSNSLNIILAALDMAASGEAQGPHGQLPEQH